MSRVYLYVVDRDFGFAPNPFHGVCTLATCKPRIRSGADVNDWVIGIGGGRLRATGRCVFALRVTETLTFNQYWESDRFLDKKPVRNGSQKMMVGDNIYSKDSDGDWHQLDSHHSNPDGTVNVANLQTDTSRDCVLISDHFFYFGQEAPLIPGEILIDLGYRNGRGYRIYDHAKARPLIDWLDHVHGNDLNQLLGDPFDFEISEKRYSASTNKVS